MTQTQPLHRIIAKLIAALVGAVLGFVFLILVFLPTGPADTPTFHVRPGHCQTAVTSQDVFGWNLQYVRVCG